MLKENVKVGMKVLFGRRVGEKTLGEVVKVNPKKAKIRQLEDRGSIRDYPVGTMWTVPFTLMYLEDPNAVPAPTVGIPRFVPPPQREKMVYNPFDENNVFYEALLGVYAGLSPENLHCDGEASMAYVRRTEAELNRKKHGLEIAIGRKVDEGDLYEWERSRREYEKKKTG